MGLSYLSNHYWHPGTDSDCMLQQQSLELELPQEVEDLVCFQDDFTLADTSIDPLFQQTTFISQPHYQFHNSSQELDFQLQQQQQQQQGYYYSKRQKTTHHYSNLPLFDGCSAYGGVSSSSADSQVVNQTDEEWMMSRDVTFPPVFACGSVDNYKKRCGSGGGGGLSAQSIAARQRRRKIADKTQELGKLIPGGHRMNTADMFHSASMYVKFLQAQIAILALTNNSLHHQEGRSEEQHQHLKLLVESPMVLEKLYTQEKCLAPHTLLQSLSKDSKLQADHPSVFQQVKTLFMTSC